MHAPRWTAPALVVFALVLTAGTGYAAFTASAFIGGTAQAGTLGPLTWGPPTAHGYGSYDSCTVSIQPGAPTNGVLDLYANNLAPGDFCGYSATLSNAGNLPATVTETITSASGGLCAVLIYSDNGFTPGVTIGAGGQTGGTSFVVPASGDISWGGTILLPSDASGVYGGQSCDFEVTLTGSAGT